VGGKNIPCTKAHRGCRGYGVDVGHVLECLRVLRVLLLKCCGEMRECGRGQSAWCGRNQTSRAKSYKVRSDAVLCATDSTIYLCCRNRNGAVAGKSSEGCDGLPDGRLSCTRRAFTLELLLLCSTILTATLGTLLRYFSVNLNLGCVRCNPWSENACYVTGINLVPASLPMLATRK
jgi:hypothetical protein